MMIVRYQRDMQARWDDFVRGSRNGTFLLERGYVDYHADRFEDSSLVVLDDGEWIGVLPAHRRDQALVSHAGLTYGGWVVSPRMTAARMTQTFDALQEWLAAEGFRTLVYKPIPFNYARAPSQEDLFCLFVKGARLVRRDLLSVVGSRELAPMQGRRARGVKKARAAGVTVTRDDGALSDYWALLERNLADRHGAKPVHTLAEMQLLMARFPGNIRLFVARRARELAAGVLVYETDTTARTQYIASTPEGRECGAMDLLLFELLTSVYANKPYIDFGSSMKDLGVLDAGLIDQKEGFGARSVALDTWEWQLT